MRRKSCPTSSAAAATRPAFYGGINTQRTLPYGTPQDVRCETESVIALMSEQGGYITASSQDIQTDVTYENLCALINTAKAHA